MELHGGHGGGMVTQLPSTSEVSVSNSAPFVGMFVVAYSRSAVDSTEP